MATTNLQTTYSGDFLIQNGNGTPNHSTLIYSKYIDLDTGIVYENTDGASTWDARNKFSDAEKSNVAANTTHKTSDGSDHSFIDQDVSSGSSPTLSGTNFTNIPLVGSASRVVIPTRNVSGSLIPKGQPVANTGYNIGSSRAEVTPADSDNLSVLPCVGLMAEDTANNANEDIVTDGKITGLDTSAWNDMDPLYVSSDPATTLGLTNVKPTGIERIQLVARVQRSHATLGEIQVFSIGRVNDIPNIPSGKIWLGNGSSVPTETTLDSSIVPMLRISGSTFSTLQHIQDVFHSSGWVSNGGITDDTDGTITVAAGTGLIRATNDPLDALLFTDWSAESGVNVNLTDNSNNFVYVEYNAGSPRVIATITERTDFHTNILLAIIYREGTTLHINTVTKHVVGDHAGLMIQRSKETMPFAHVSGASISETGTRNFALTSGAFWEGLTKFITSAFDSSTADTYSAFWESGASVWTEIVAQSQIDNTQWNNGFILDTLSNNRYGVRWVYLSTDSDVSVLFGKGDYTLSEAENADAPSSVPPEIGRHSRLIGKITIQKNAASFAFDPESVFDKSFETATPTDHSGLLGLPNDDHLQYHTDGRALTWLGTRSTSDLSEGTNLYYTEVRVSANTDVTTNTAKTSNIPIATDVIWDALGDLAVGSGADTASNLSIGSANQNLKVNSGGTNLEYVTEVGMCKFSIEAGITSGTATANFLASNGFNEYEIMGSGGGVSREVFYSTIVPPSYKSGGTFKIDSWTTDFTNLTKWDLTVNINGTVDATISALDITPTADTTYQTTTNSLGSSISPGDVIQVHVSFTGVNADDIRYRRITMEFNV